MIKTSKEKISKILKDLDINKESYIIIHCSSFMFGKIEGGIKTLYNSLKANLSQNNTLIFPSFTYSYRKNQIFDIVKTPCDNQIGILSEIARKDKTSYRNDDPLFSFVAIGNDKEIINRTNKTCFGENSIYKKIFDKNLHILSLGVEFTHGISEFLHIEKLANVAYRYNRIFKGISVSKKRHKYNDYANHFVKCDKFFKYYKYDRQILGEELIKKKICKKINYGYGNILLFDGSDFLDYALKRLKRNNYIMVKKK